MFHETIVCKFNAFVTQISRTNNKEEKKTFLFPWRGNKQQKYFHSYNSSVETKSCSVVKIVIFF